MLFLNYVHNSRWRFLLIMKLVGFLILFLGLCMCGITVKALDEQGEALETLPLDLYELNKRLHHLYISSSNLNAYTMDNSSSCSTDQGCPMSSMVWASGTFTLSDLLTPSSFLVASNLTLKMSLCCGYKYNGRLLRDESLYDMFLHVLLQASPFQVLTKEEKRNMFPREDVIIIDTVQQKRYDATYVLTEEDIRQGNDGDGDVIILVSGAVGDGINRIPLYHTTEGLTTLTPTDIHLKIANVALKCKCPHTLLVMPMLRVRPDSLAPISILGVGSHCGQRLIMSTLKGSSNSNINNIVQLRDKTWAVSFALSPPQLPATRVHWVVTDKTTSKVVLDELFYTVWETDQSGTLLPRHANCSYFKVIPHHKYEVFVTVSRGAALQTASGFFVMRLPLDSNWEIEPVKTQLHFGFERSLRISKHTLNHPGLRDALAPRHVTAEYFGYWENTPSDDQLLPQTLRRVQHNPFTEETVAYSLFLGRNNVSFYVSDIDEVCEPTLLEVQELWAFQGILLQPSISPTTVCRDDVVVEALPVKSLVAAARSTRQLPLQFLSVTRDLVRNSEIIEGRFDCMERGAGMCSIHATDTSGGTSGVLRMRRRGVAELVWVLQVEVKDIALVPPESLDSTVARVVDRPAGNSGSVVVEVHSRAAVVVRRISTLPESVKVTLPMSLQRLTLHPPQSLDGAADEVLSGRWIVSAPLHLVSVSDAFVAEIDTSRVPNVEQMLRKGTVQFVAEDPGEAVDLGVPYTSRCPPRFVEHTVTVVPIAAKPIIPALVAVYTEDSCVRLKPPRSALKDEEIHWHIPYCEEATKPLRIVQGQPSSEDQYKKEEANAEVDDAMVCGVEVYRWCDVIWTARNLVGSVTQTFSLRRCQRPPQLLFHRDGLQKSHSTPYTVYALPSTEWLIGYEGSEINSGSGDGDSSVSEGEEALPRRRYTTRRVIPIAGYEATVGYSFNYTESQQDFETNFTYMHVAAHQLKITQQHFERSGVVNKNDEMAAAAAAAPLSLRRFVRLSKGDDDSNDGDNITIHKTGFTVDEGANGTDGWGSRLTHRVLRRDEAMDIDSDARVSLVHQTESRRLQFLGLSNSSHYPFFHETGTSSSATRLKRDAAEFAKRGMCVSQRGDVSVFALSPKGVVSVGVGGVLPFCYSSYEFSRHPWLHTKYQFDFLWLCEDTGVITVERYTPTFSVLHHSGHANETRCRLTVRNSLTETEQTDEFVMRRVYPTSLPQVFKVLSGNAANGNCLAEDTARLKQTRTTTVTTSDSTTNVGHGGRSTTTRWVVGKSVILHVDANVETENSQWRAISVVPEVVSSIGTQLLLDSIDFVPLTQYAHTTDGGSSGARVLVTGINTPGLYTFGYYHPDPLYPSTCPNVSVLETFHVVHAQVVEKELTVCEDFVMLKALPIPREIDCHFVGRWEVVSLQTSINETRNDDVSLTGIRFEHGSQPTTLVRGLPFGIVTVRWAIYAVSLEDDKDIGKPDQEHGDQGRVLVDYDTVRLLVLTDNLQSNRLVTLSDTVHIFGTSSTLNWVLKEKEASSSILLSRGPHLRIETISKNIHNIGGGTHNSLGHEVIVLTKLPIGITHLEYTLHPSGRVFGSMLSKKCLSMRRQVFVIERVSAFLSANTTLDHECDAYSGHGQLSICLHAEGVQDVGVSSLSSFSSSSSSASLLGARLVSPDTFEAVVKGGAARLAEHGCSLPWWVHHTTRWFNIRADAARRCISFNVAATRHLQLTEVSHFVFLTQERLGSPHACPNAADFMTSEIIEGASTWSDSAAARDPLFQGGDILQFLPFLHPVTLVRDERSMRPMLSLLGVPDVVASELDIGDEGNAVAVVLRLDTVQPKQMGGFTYAASNMQDSHQKQRDSLLAKCVSGTVLGSDVLQFWREVNRPDGVEGQTAKEWLEYVEAVRDKHVSCEPLFASLSHLLLRPDDTDATVRSRRAQRVPPKEQQLVSLEVIEQQLVGLQRDFRWTREGIDVTGLHAELQAALLRRRITKSQLEEIENVRRVQGFKQEEKERQQQSILGDESAKLTREEVFEKVLRLYKGVLDEEVAAIRLTLPRYEPFSVPHNLFLRTALHKDVICGTNISAVNSMDSLVLFGRVEIMDVPPVVGVTPAAFKQCEVEGGIPVVHVNVCGLTFIHVNSFPADHVLLEEVHNPNRTGAADLSPDVGLMPCLKQMQTGMHVTISPFTYKQLELKLSPCPSFQMLSPSDYNEQQSSELLWEKMLFPRLLRVTLRSVLVEDSHTRGKTSVSFLVEVRPTLARLHLRPLLSDKAVEMSSEASSWSEPAARRPLLMCEADVRRRGVELGVELIGDQWHELVGESEIDDDDNVGGGGMYVENTWPPSSMADALNRGTKIDILSQSGWADKKITSNSNNNGGGSVQRRIPHNVALINSFSIVEHYRFDSAHHLLLRHGGLYRSHFISYLFSSVMTNSNNIRRHKFIHRYNDTFVSVRIPAEPPGSDVFFYGGESGAKLDGDHLPPIRLFSTIEEILFAVPGIATECRGCLLADTTYFVAGDLTGLWSFPPAMPPLMLNNALLVGPLRVPFYAAPHVPREWRFTTLCPSAAWDNLRYLWELWKPPRVLNDGQSFLQMELVVYSLRDMRGGEVPLSKRFTVILASAPLPLDEVLNGDQGKKRNIADIVFKVNASAAERAHAMMAADFARYGRRHLHTVHDYVQDDAGAGVALAVNASVFLRICVPPTTVVPETQCSIVSLTHSLLIMEEPRAASYYVRLGSMSWRSILSPVVILHHAGSALVLYIILLRVPAVCRAFVIGRTHGLSTTRTGLAAVLFVAMTFFYRMAPSLWAVIWTLLWATLFSLVPEFIVGVYYVLHFLFWAFVM